LKAMSLDLLPTQPLFSIALAGNKSENKRTDSPVLKDVA